MAHSCRAAALLMLASAAIPRHAGREAAALLQAARVHQVEEAPGGTEQNASVKPGARINAVFVAGSEGTSHHFMGELFTQCSNAHACYIDEYSCGLSRALEDAHDKRQGVRDGLHRCIARGDLLSKDELFVVNTGSRPQWSYPDEDFGSPLLPLFIEAAESINVDVKVVLLVREAEEAFCSTKNRFNDAVEGGITAGRHLEAIQILRQQLSQIGRGRVFCVDYNKLSDGAPPGLNQFLGLTSWDLEAAVETTFESHDPETCSWTDADQAVRAELNEAMKKLQSTYC